MTQRKRYACAAALAVTAALATSSSVRAEPPELVSKRTEAQQVLVQIQALDATLEQAVEAWNAANVRLAALDEDLRRTRKRLRLAEKTHAEAQKRLEARLVGLYEAEAPDALAVLLGAANAVDLIEAFDTIGRIAAEDRRIVEDVNRTRERVRRHKEALDRARAEQKVVLARRATEREAIEQKLALRKRLLASISAEIERLEAAERERQRRLAAEAQARLAAQRRAAAREERRDRDRSSPQRSSAPQGPAASPSPPPAPPAAPPAAPPPPAPAPPPPPAPVNSGGGRADVVSIALRYLGTPYRWGGASPSTGFDCSGFVLYVFAQVGVSLPHSAAMQYNYGSSVSRSALQPGDLVFFNGLGHNGIYIGGGNFVHSPRTGDVVKISSLSESWYASRWVGARRIL